MLVVELVVLWFLGGSQWAGRVGSAATYRAGVSWQSWWGSWRDPHIGARDLRCQATNTSGKRVAIPPRGDRPVALVVSSGCSSCTMGSLRRWARFAQGHKDLDVWAIALLDSQGSLQRRQAKFPAGLKWARASLADLRALNLRFVPRVYVFDSTGRLIWLQRQAFEHDEALPMSVAEAALGKGEKAKR